MNTCIIRIFCFPVEASGSIKSLHQFMHDTLLSLPGYLLWRARELVQSTRG